MPQDTSGVTMLKFYKLGSQADLKQNQHRLLKILFKSPDKRDGMLQNRHELNGSGVFVRK